MKKLLKPLKRIFLWTAALMPIVIFFLGGESADAEESYTVSTTAKYDVTADVETHAYSDYAYSEMYDPAKLSGQCGDNLTWTIEENTLTISGTGPMWDYTCSGPPKYTTDAPWWEYRDSITLLKLEDGITHVGDYAFFECMNLSGELEIPESVTTIGVYAFYLCKGFTGELKIPEGVTSIAAGAFNNCRGFTGELKIPEGVTAIGNSAFSYCSGLTGELKIPEGVTSIGVRAFEGCSGLTGELKIPEGVTTIGEDTFASCSGFTGKLKIPKGVTTIGHGAFARCSGFIGELEIPEGVIDIGRYAFISCNFTSLKISNGETNIDKTAFFDCRTMKQVCFIDNALSDVTFLNELTAGIPVYYPASKSSWEEVVAANPQYNWIMYDGEIPDYIPDDSTSDNPTSAEKVTSFVKRMYTVALGRDAETEGCDWWANALLNGDSDGAGLAYGFLLGDEFKNKGYSNVEYVEVLYATFFDREIADGEGDFWINGLDSGSSRESVLSGFVNSEEFFNLCTSYGISRGVMYEDGTAINSGIGKFAERLYTEVLEREGEEGGMEYWATSIVKGDCTPEDAAKNFFQSPEYLNKNSTDAEYVKALYRTFMDRECDEAGLNYWVNALGTEVTRETVLGDFAASEEFKKIMASYGL